jgi:serine protease
MASPHVAGAVVELWRLCGNCTNYDIEECIFDSAKDLGSAGKDPEYGHGLLQTRDAYLCLVYTAGCCK